MEDLKTKRLKIALNNFQRSLEKKKDEDMKKINSKKDFESLSYLLSYVGVGSKDDLLAKISSLIKEIKSIKEILYFFTILGRVFDDDENMRIEDFEEVLLMLEYKAVELIENVDISSDEEIYYDLVEMLERFGRDHYEIESLVCNEAIPEPVIHALLSKIKEIHASIK